MRRNSNSDSLQIFCNECYDEAKSNREMSNSRRHDLFLGVLSKAIDNLSEINKLKDRYNTIVNDKDINSIISAYWIYGEKTTLYNNFQINELYDLIYNVCLPPEVQFEAMRIVNSGELF